MQQTTTFLKPEPYFSSPFLQIQNESSSDSKEKNLLGKKINNDTDLILWLSGKEINQKLDEERTVPSELNSKLKRKLRNKLIKTAKKCELYYINNFANKEYIFNKCSYCLKKIFDHNELLRFVNFQDFVYYLKYIFYLSEQVISYSTNNFKNNKKDSDILFSKFEKKEENWIFDKEKIICKLCLFILINKPNFIQNIKEIFFEGKCDNEFIIDELIEGINYDEFYNIKYEEVIQKKRNNRDNKKLFNNRYNYDIPKKTNIYKPNNINININNANIFNNNYNYNNVNDLSDYKSFIDFKEKISNNPQEYLNPGEFTEFFKKLFFLNHNQIIDFCKELSLNLQKLINDTATINNSQNDSKEHNINIQTVQNTIYLLLNKILALMNNTSISLYVYMNDYSNNIILVSLLNNLLYRNIYNLSRMENTMSVFFSACNL
jgi:hypothetical protein